MPVVDFLFAAYDSDERWLHITIDIYKEFLTDKIIF